MPVLQRKGSAQGSRHLPGSLGDCNDFMYGHTAAPLTDYFSGGPDARQQGRPVRWKAVGGRISPRWHFPARLISWLLMIFC